MIRFIRAFFPTLLLCWTLPLLAMESPHQAVDKLQQTAQSLISELNAKPVYWREHPQALQALVKRQVMGHIDQQALAQQVVGRRAWFQATPAQRQAFMDCFANTVIKTYSAAMTSSTNPRVTFLPIRETQTRSLIRIRSRVQADEHPPVTVIYQLQSTPTGWKIVDFSVDGISLVNSYRAQFSSVLAQHGLGTLTQRLQRR